MRHVEFIVIITLINITIFIHRIYTYRRTKNFRVYKKVYLCICVCRSVYFTVSYSYVEVNSVHNSSCLSRRVTSGPVSTQQAFQFVALFHASLSIHLHAHSSPTPSIPLSPHPTHSHATHSTCQYCHSSTHYSLYLAFSHSSTLFTPSHIVTHSAYTSFTCVTHIPTVSISFLHTLFALLKYFSDLHCLNTVTIAVFSPHLLGAVPILITHKPWELLLFSIYPL